MTIELVSVRSAELGRSMESTYRAGSHVSRGCGLAACREQRTGGSFLASEFMIC